MAVVSLGRVDFEENSMGRMKGVVLPGLGLRARIVGIKKESSSVMFIFSPGTRLALGCPESWASGDVRF